MILLGMLKFLVLIIVHHSMLTNVKIALGINRSFGSPEKKFSINYTKANTKFCLSLNYNADNSYLFVNRKK